MCNSINNKMEYENFKKRKIIIIIKSKYKIQYNYNDISSSLSHVNAEELERCKFVSPPGNFYLHSPPHYVKLFVLDVPAANGSAL